jgi:hypothetical protein
MGRAVRLRGKQIPRFARDDNVKAKGESQEPRAKSQEPRAKSQERVRHAICGRLGWVWDDGAGERQRRPP